LISKYIQIPAEYMPQLELLVSNCYRRLEMVQVFTSQRHQKARSPSHGSFSSNLPASQEGGFACSEVVLDPWPRLEVFAHNWLQGPETTLTNTSPYQLARNTILP